MTYEGLMCKNHGRVNGELPWLVKANLIKAKLGGKLFHIIVKVT